MSNSRIPDDGDWTETRRSCFNVNFNILLKQLYCASVGKEKTLKFRATSTSRQMWNQCFIYAYENKQYVAWYLYFYM
jgi:hypothetical protein